MVSDKSMDGNTLLYGSFIWSSEIPFVLKLNEENTSSVGEAMKHGRKTFSLPFISFMLHLRQLIFFL